MSVPLGDPHWASAVPQAKTAVWDYICTSDERARLLDPRKAVAADFDDFVVVLILAVVGVAVVCRLPSCLDFVS